MLREYEKTLESIIYQVYGISTPIEGIEICTRLHKKCKPFTTVKEIMSIITNSDKHLFRIDFLSPVESGPHKAITTGVVSEKDALNAIYRALFYILIHSNIEMEKYIKNEIQIGHFPGDDKSKDISIRFVYNEDMKRYHIMVMYYDILYGASCRNLAIYKMGKESNTDSEIYIKDECKTVFKEFDKIIQSGNVEPVIKLVNLFGEALEYNGKAILQDTWCEWEEYDVGDFTNKVIEEYVETRPNCYNTIKSNVPKKTIKLPKAKDNHIFIIMKPDAFNYAKYVLKRTDILIPIFSEDNNEILRFERSNNNESLKNFK